MRRTIEHKGHEGLGRFRPPCGEKPYVLCALVYYDCLGRDPIYPSFYRLRGGRVYMDDPVEYKCI
jgi:hypothetical protein